MKQRKVPGSSISSSSRNQGGGAAAPAAVKNDERWRRGGGGGGGERRRGTEEGRRGAAAGSRQGFTSMRSDGVIVPGGGGGTQKQKVLKNALRNAQLDKSQLLMWRKFGYGEQLFAQYYRKQKIVPDAELPLLRATFATPLPITFRLHATDPRAAAFAARLHELAERRPNPLVKPLPWMPEGEGWQALLADALGGSRGGDGAGGTAAARSHTYIGRREKLPDEVAEVVREGTEAGLLARQEAVSMLPVLILAASLPLRPGSRVLDVCAAPGNKTMQLLERCAPPRRADESSSSHSGGLVVANDAHPGRVMTLHEAITRHCRRAGEMESLVITCALGQNIPAPTFTGDDDDDDDDDASEVRGYDAVLTDVPCSGDGTLRKDPDVLRRWHPGCGNCLHATQLAVARRAAALVRPGGLLLYSTCSLNPVEDEAVVAGILTGPGGDEWEIEIGAAEKGAPGMKCRPGMSTWGVAEHALKGNRGGVNASAPPALYHADSDADLDADSDSESDREVSLRWYGSYDEAAAAGMPAAAATMWPPATLAEAKKLHLERCARFLPHDQDTGGFFVALLRRREAMDTATEGDGEGRGEQRQQQPQGVEKTKKPKKKDKKEAKDDKVKAAAAARAMGDLSDPVRPLPPGEAFAVAAHLGLDSHARRRLWLGARGTVTLAPRAANGCDVLMELGPIAMASAGVVALKTRVLAWDEDKDAGGGFPYDFTQAGAEALAPLARKRRVQIVPTDLQVMLAARASGVDGPEVVARENEVLCLTPDEMSDATRRRWVQSQRGAVVFVLLKRSSSSLSSSSPAAAAAPTSSTAETTTPPPPPPPYVAFAVAGRCSDDGFMLSPELNAAESKRLLARLSEVAGLKNRGQNKRQQLQQQQPQQQKRRRQEAEDAREELLQHTHEDSREETKHATEKRKQRKNK